MKIDIHPYLSFNGQCEAAFKFYEKCLGAKIQTLLRYGDSPMAKKVNQDWHSKIIHATLALDNHELLSGSDAFPDQFIKPQGFQVTLDLYSPTDAEHAFKALTNKGSIVMDLQKTFWAARFGMLVDQFGTPWMINCGEAE